jgi:hypothetical protein
VISGISDQIRPFSAASLAPAIFSVVCDLAVAKTGIHIAH